MKGHFEKVVRKAEVSEVKCELFKLETSDNETKSSSDEGKTHPHNFIENGWRNKAPQEPKGLIFKAKTCLFKHSMDKIETC